MRVGVLGASGMIGLQLIEALSAHPAPSELLPFSRSCAGKTFAAIHPALKHYGSLRFVAPDHETLRSLDVLFMALPHGESVPYVELLESSKTVIIDLSADFRLRDAEAYGRVHGRPHARADLLAEFCRVCPDLNGVDARSRRMISVPGCTASAAILSLVPLVEQNVLGRSRVVIDAKVSSSGAGASSGPAQSHMLRSGGVRTYRLLRQHRHCSEVESFVHELTDVSLDIVLNVSSVDMVRGISASLFVETTPDATNRTFNRAYRNRYAENTFVRVIRQNAGYERYPNPRFLGGTNFCDIGFEVAESGDHAVVIAALDNLVRGGAGQAVQAWNYQQGFAPDTGLCTRVLYP